MIHFSYYRMAHVFFRETNKLEASPIGSCVLCVPTRCVTCLLTRYVLCVLCSSLDSLTTQEYMTGEFEMPEVGAQGPASIGITLADVMSVKASNGTRAVDAAPTNSSVDTTLADTTYDSSVSARCYPSCHILLLMLLVSTTRSHPICHMASKPWWMKKVMVYYYYYYYYYYLG